MTFICKLCRKQLINSVQCINCYDIICTECSEYCNDCDTHICCPCSKRQINYSIGIMKCSDCKSILCNNCAYIMDYLNKDNSFNAKYCIKNGCYSNHESTCIVKSSITGELELKKVFPNLINYIKKIKQENEDLKIQVEYMPDGEGYIKAKEHFSRLVEKKTDT